MRPSTTRRALVFAVSLAGVVALYWVPNAVRAPAPVGAPGSPHGARSVHAASPAAGTGGRVPTTPVTERAVPAARSSDPFADPGSAPAGATGPTATPAAADHGKAGATPATTSPAERHDPADPVESPAADGRTPAAGATRTAPADPPTTETVEPTVTTGSSQPVGPVPGQVSGLHVVTSDYLGLVVGWAPEGDAAGYVVDLNGFRVGGTTGTEAALRWFNDDMTEHFVQVRAVGEDGRVSADAAYLQVRRPASPDPTSSAPSPSATPSISTGDPSPTEEPTAPASATR